MSPSRREICQGLQDKCPVLQPGVRQSGLAGPGGGNFSMKIKKIEIDHPGSIGHRSYAAKCLFHVVKALQQSVSR